MNNAREQVNALVDAIFDNPEEIKAGIDRIEEESRLVDSLLASRRAAGLSQRELAQASGMSPSKICRMESGTDANLRFGDIQKYLAGLGSSLRVDIQTPRRRCPRARRPRPVPALA